MASRAMRQRELAYRSSDGVEVVLLWHELTNDVTVCVSDRHTGAYFEIAAAPEHALDVFDHPYAYAAFGRPQREEASPASWRNAASTPALALITEPDERSR